MFLFTELAMQRAVFHVDREQVARRRKGKHFFVFKCLQILFIMLKAVGGANKQDLERSIYPVFLYILDTNTDAKGLLLVLWAIPFV